MQNSQNTDNNVKNIQRNVYTFITHAYIYKTI